MAGHGSTEEGRWSDEIPDDLLGVIYRRCCSSPYDRARFAAVCTSWRRAASGHSKLPALPLLLNSTGDTNLDRKARAYCPQDNGRVLRARLPWFPHGKRIVGSHDGGWIAATIGSRISIMNPFTRVSLLPLSARKSTITCRCPTAQRRTTNEFSIEKVIFSEDPAASHGSACILAAITTDCMIALCRLHRPKGRWTTRGYGADIRTWIIDIAFCNGHLYGLSRGGLFYKLVLGLNKEHDPVVISFDELTIQRPDMFYPRYIFELHGKLSTTVEIRPAKSTKARRFRVFQLAETTQPFKYRWIEVTTLGDHALFLGPGCCKAVHVSPSLGGMHGDIERNRIYYSDEHYPLDDEKDSKCKRRLDLGSCYVYCYESQGVHHSEKIMSRGYHYCDKDDGLDYRSSCTWILPPPF